MSRVWSHPLLSIIAVLGLASTLSAVESELRLGPDEYLLDTEFLSQYVEQGAVRIEDVTWRGRARGRWSGFGLEAEAFMAIDKDDRFDYSRGELVEIRARMDYIFEIEGYAQIIPYIGVSLYPADVYDVDEPVWIGAEVWYMLPAEGIETGGSINVDAGGEYGLYADYGFRELLQVAPLDLQAWQTISYGNGEFHEFTSGHDESGFGVINLGMLATLPMPWEDTYATLRAELFGWLEDDDRDQVDESIEFVIGIGFEWRP